jgi:hypothetical protein
MPTNILQKKYYKTLVAHIHQQIHVINEAIAKQREAEVDLPKYKTSTEKKEAEEAREKPVKEAVTSLMCIIDAIKHSVEANALMDDHFGKRDVYAAVAEAALIEDVIKHSSFSIFNLMAVTSGHNRFNLAREWVKAVRTFLLSLCLPKAGKSNSLWFLFFFCAHPPKLSTKFYREMYLYYSSYYVLAISQTQISNWSNTFS